MSSVKCITLQDCDRAVKKYLKSEDVETIDFSIDNCLLKVTVNHNVKKKVLKFYTKLNQNNRRKVNDIFDEFKKNIPRFNSKIIPEIYYGNSNVLLFEDLTSQGFESYKFGNLNLDHLQVALGVLSKFHAGSLAYEEIKFQETEKNYRLNKEFEIANPKELNFEAISSRIPQNYEDQLKDLVENLNKEEDNYRKTLCHGNLMAENLMFKSDNGKPVDCKLVNFKSECYASPFYDVLQLIYFNTTNILRQHFLQELFQFYYKNLEKELDKYSLKIEEILPIDEMKSVINFLLPKIKIETISHKVDTNTVGEIVEMLNHPRISREDCYIIVKNKLGTTNYDFHSFFVIPLDKVSGYLGEYFKLRIKITQLQKKQTLHCFIKGTPKGKSGQKIISTTSCFSKEIFFYESLVELTRQYGISAINDCVTMCYFQRSQDMIVFEDMSVKNYCNLSPQIPYDYNLLVLAIKKLAKFHASFLVLEEKLSQSTGSTYRLKEHFGKYLEEVYFIEADHFGAKLMSAGVKSILDVIELYPSLKTEENQAKVARVWPKLVEIFYKVTLPSSVYRNVLSHGDIWTNNIMVLMEEKEPIDCCFVDFQCTRYCPPAHDFLSIMYLTTNRATRLKYEEELKRVYHNELARILAKYNCNINEICPFNEFIASIEYIRPQITMQCIMYSMFCTCTSDDIKSFVSNETMSTKVFFEDRKEYLVEMSKKSEIFRNKLQECLIDFYDICESF